MKLEDTIVALSTPPGVGAIGVIRLSGSDSFDIFQKVFRGKNLSEAASHTAHFGLLADGEEIVDEVVATIFKGPHSYTKEDVVEISCHGSPYILKRVIELFLREGARLAGPGEFTQRAFLHGRFDLAQAEAVADLIAAESKSAHDTAMKQMRGGFSNEIQQLRERLIHFASMIELELDFSEEDVEFASRDELKALVLRIQQVVTGLVNSFELGNVLKNGIPVVIAGKPNAGKSTLLNALLNEERAIVSDIPGTTRDVIEDAINIDGVIFRFVDTAGLRETDDQIESIGVGKTKERMQQASVIIYLVDLEDVDGEDLRAQVEEVKALGVPYLVVGNKEDVASVDGRLSGMLDLQISAKEKAHLDVLKSKLVELSHVEAISAADTIVTSSRHYEGLRNTSKALDKVLEGIDSQITNDFLAMDIRASLNYLGELTGDITTDDLLENIFSKFCIGK
ncbi:MAG: tRNA uridine-5-carboxymethylaminomethyl(34) synthesis GTPase MnmE [Bacteroidota bacterium]